MGHCTRTLLCTLCSISLLLIARVNSTSSGNVNSERINDILQSLLGFKGKPRLQQDFNVEEDAPKYMLDLYELVKDGQTARQLRSDTVRSIKATTGMFVSYQQ